MYIIKILKMDEEKYVLIRREDWHEAVDDINKATQYESEEEAKDIAFNKLSLGNLYNQIEVIKINLGVE